MASSVTIGFVVAATAVSGLLAGTNIDRLIVQMPAWEQVGVLAWATYSREADLGNALRGHTDLCGGGVGTRGPTRNHPGSPLHVELEGDRE